jgi:hemoglobin-like flavoprotein
MTPKQADLIRHSFDAIWPVRRKVAELFYCRFFELAPDAQRLFPSDMERQHLKLMDMIAAIVGALDKHELFQSIIRHTGRQHADLGVKRSHFDAFGDALIWCWPPPDHLGIGRKLRQFLPAQASCRDAGTRPELRFPPSQLERE